MMIELPTEAPGFLLGGRWFHDRREAAIATVMKALGGHHAETQRIATLIVDQRHTLRPALDWLDQVEQPTPALKVVRR